MKRSILTVAAFSGMLGLAACGGGDDARDAGFDETMEPYGTDPTTAPAPPAGMGMDTMGMDTMGMGAGADTMMR